MPSPRTAGSNGAGNGATVLDLSQFYEVFFEEAAEHLAEMENLLLGLDPATASDDELNAIFRAAHSIKGGSGTFGFTDMTAVTHELESLLDRARKHELTLTVEMVDALLAAGDILKGQLACHRGHASAAPDASECCARIRMLAQGDAALAPLTATGKQAGSKAKKPAKPKGKAKAVAAGTAATAGDDDNEGFGFFDDAPGRPGTAAAASAAAPAFEDPGYGFFDPLPAAAVPATSATMVSETVERRVENRGRRATDHAEAEVPVTGRREADKAAAGGTGSAAAEMTSIRVGVEKVDQLINLVGELVITQAMLAQTASKAEGGASEELTSSMAHLERNTRDLQEAVMSIRMMPISFVFNRFPRVVRDLAAKLNKQVNLKTIGEGTEIDKGLIEKLADPLTHLVRNSLDHGIETPDVREAAGKPAAGTITLHAYHQGGNIIIAISDDGAGLNRQRILDKALERGLPVNQRMSDNEVWQLIFEAGFSTAAVVTDVSGRGVGMDVVKRNIKAMGGRVDIESNEGEGTKILISLPLTLAILDGMSVSVGGELYILPLTCIVESLQPRREDIKSVQGGNVICVREEYLPVIPLHDVFGAGTRPHDLTQGIFVIIEANERKTALFVDALVGQHQVVIKSLETNFRRVHGISGATIMGDGRVALIVDAAALSASAGASEPAPAGPLH